MGTEGELVHVQPAMLAGLSPATLIEAATEIATELRKVIDQQGLAVDLGSEAQPSEHVKIEGWLTAGAMVQTFPHIIYSETIRDTEGRLVGFKATAQAKTLEGRIVATADALCTRDEKQRIRRGKRAGTEWYPWADKPAHQVLSMAETRAASKVMGFACRWIITMAGYSGTPAEEVVTEEPPEDGEDRPAGPTMATDPELTETVAPEVAREEAATRERVGKASAAAGKLARDPATRRRAATERPARVDVGGAAGKLVLLPWDEFFQRHGINAAQAASIIRSRYPDALKPEGGEAASWPAVVKEGEALPEGGTATQQQAAASAANELQRAAVKLTSLEPNSALAAQDVLVTIMQDLPQTKGEAG
jgi:hypothetical protein